MRILIGVALLTYDCPVYLAQAQLTPALPSVQPVAAPSSSANASDILVTTPRLPGSVDTTILPIKVLMPRDIAGYAASDIGELIGEVMKEVGDRGRQSPAPVILINGRRMASMSEISDLPPEAIAQFEVFPEQVAIDYGYSAEQKLMNVILVKSYKAHTAELSTSAATQGGYGNQDGSASSFRINGNKRLNISAKIGRTTAISEGERRVVDGVTIPTSQYGTVSSIDGSTLITGSSVMEISAPEGGGALSAFSALADQPTSQPDFQRDLTPASQSMKLSGSLGQPMGKQGNISATLSYGLNMAKDVLGFEASTVTLRTDTPGSPFTAPVTLTRVFDQEPLSYSSKGHDVSVSTAMNSGFGKWDWSMSGSYTRRTSTSRTERGVDEAALQSAVNAGLNPFVQNVPLTILPDDHSKTHFQNVISAAHLRGNAFRVPAGEVKILAQLGGDALRYKGSSTYGNISSAFDLKRTIIAGAFALDLPITSTRENFLAFLGDVLVSGRIANRRFSDMGDLPNYMALFNWRTKSRLTVTGKYSYQQDAPGITLLGSPRVVTPNRLIYDFSRGETQYADVISGGNPNLIPEKRRDITFEAGWKIFEKKDLNFGVSYNRFHMRDTAKAFPFLTAQVEAAFPGRVQRSADGEIVAIDQRPVNISAYRMKQLAWSANYSTKVGPPAHVGRLSLSISHTRRLNETQVVAPNLPVFDYVRGAAFSADGGLPHHEVQFDSSWSRNGHVIQASGNWRSGTRVTDGDTSVLQFSPRLLLNLRASLDLDKRAFLIRASNFFKGARLSLGVSNMFGRYINVRDDLGETPSRYQSAYMDPFGRLFDISLRKQF